MKKVLSLVLVLALSLSLSVPALAARRTPTARDSLKNDYERIAYDKASQKLEDIAKKLSRDEIPESTTVEIFVEDDLGIPLTWTSESLGMQISDSSTTTSAEKTAVLNKIAVLDDAAIRRVYYAVTYDYPQYISWVYGWRYSSQTYSFIKTTSSDGSPCIIVGAFSGGAPNFNFSFLINKHYNSTGETFSTTFRTGRGADITGAWAEAQRLVDSVSGKSDYEKVVAYQRYICENNVYNRAAANGGEPKSDTRNLVYVFDRNANTNVVCEGYAKAFKYLCDLSGIPCIIVTSKGHMWNLVQMDDEKYYHADITFCDVTDYNCYHDLFLLKAPQSRSGNAYTIAGGKFKIPDGRTATAAAYTYEYEDTTLNVWGSQLPTLASTDYKPVSIILKSDDSTVISSYYVNRGEQLTPPADPVKDGYVFKDWAKADGTPFNFATDTIATTEKFDTILIAQWEVDPTTQAPHTVTYVTERGETPAVQTVNYGESATEPTMPDVDEYKFTGWYTEDGTKFDFSSKITTDITLTAKWAPKTYSVIVNPTTNGTVSVSSSTAAAGKEITVTATPANGYELDSITVTPSTAVTNGKFTMPGSDVTVTVTFKAIPVAQLTGTVTVSGTPKVGETLTASVTGSNNSGKLSYQWKAGDENVGANKATYQPTAADIGKTITCVVTSSVETGSIVNTPTAAVIAATVPQPTAYNISVNSMTNGTAKVSKTPAVAGEEITVTATPVSGYELDSITVTPSTTVTNGKFTMPASDVTVTVTFKAVASTPDPEPTPTPTPTPGPEPDPEPDPEPTPAPNPEPTPEPEPSTPVNPDPGTTPEPSSKPSTPDNTETKQEPKQETKQETTISLNRSRLDLNTGNFGALTAAVTPSGSVTWSSSDTRVVTVDSNGSYFATGAGSATISVSANGKTATCYVTVTDPTFSANYTPYIPSGTQTTQSGTQTNTRTPGVGSETTNTTATPTTDVFTTVVDNPDGTRFTVVDNRNGISSIVQKDSYGQLLFESVTYSAAALARSNSVITAPETVIPAYTEAGATEIQFTVPQSSGKQTVRIPVENATDTTVAVAMNMVGPSEPILDSHIEGNYLVFTTNGSATVKVIEGAKYFDDVSSANWFNSAVAWVSSHGVMVGTKANLFSPYANITRAQMAQLLYNLSGTSSESVTSRFSDIGGHWYDKSVSWAVSNELVSPQSQGYFGATADATRADMVTALYRYAKANGINTSARADLSKFSDAATLTGEARDAMSWAVGIGLVNGSTQNNSRTVVLDPQGTVTRAQMATLLQRYCEVATAS